MASALYTLAIVIDEKTVIPLGSAAFILTGVWWLGRKLQQLDDSIKEIHNRVSRLETKK